MDSLAMETVDWEEIQSKLVANILDDFQKLKYVWERIGFEKEMLEDRCEQTLVHFSDLSKSMIDEDEDLYQRLLEGVKTQKETLHQYCNELELEVPQITDGPPLFLKRQLVTYLEKVTKLRQTRLDNLEELRTREAKLCCCLDVEEHVFERQRPVPSAQDLEELLQHTNMLLTEQETRMRKYRSMCKDIQLSMKVLQKKASSPLEVEVMSELPTDPSDIKLSREKLFAMEELSAQLDREKEERSKRLQDLIKELSFLWEFLQQDKGKLDDFLRENGHCGERGLNAIEKEIARCKDLRSANMGRFIENMRLELVEWWEKCKASHQQRQAFNAHFTSDDFTEDLLKVHEREVQYWRDLFQQFEPLFVKVDRITALFQKTLQLQQRTTDKNRFHNRGGQLLKEEKERKKVLLLIPKMVSELLEHGTKYEQRVGTPFLIGGETLEQYLRSQWDLIQQEKENDRLQRKQRKEEELSVATPRKQTHLTASSMNFKSPGSVARGMTLRSPAPKSPGTTLKNTPARQQLLKSPMQQGVLPKTPNARATPLKRRQAAPPVATPAKLSRAETADPLSYSTFEAPLKDPERSATKRSTMNSSVQKVLGSRHTPIFNNSGARRKRYSRSPKLSARNASRNSPRHPILTSKKKTGDNLKLAVTEMPFLY